VDANKEATKEWVACLTFMWDAIGKPVDNARLDTYMRTFKTVPIALLEKGIDRAISNNGDYNVIPAIGAIWNGIRKELGDGRPDLDVMDAIELWKEQGFEKCIIRFEVCNDKQN